MLVLLDIVVPQVTVWTVVGSLGVAGVVFLANLIASNAAKKDAAELKAKELAADAQTKKDAAELLRHAENDRRHVAATALTMQVRTDVAREANEILVRLAVIDEKLQALSRAIDPKT